MKAGQPHLLAAMAVGAAAQLGKTAGQPVLLAARALLPGRNPAVQQGLLAHLRASATALWPRLKPAGQLAAARAAQPPAGQQGTLVARAVAANLGPAAQPGLLAVGQPALAARAVGAAAQPGLLAVGQPALAAKGVGAAGQLGLKTARQPAKGVGAAGQVGLKTARQPGLAARVVGAARQPGLTAGQPGLAATAVGAVRQLGLTAGQPDLLATAGEAGPAATTEAAELVLKAAGQPDLLAARAVGAAALQRN